MAKSKQLLKYDFSHTVNRNVKFRQNNIFTLLKCHFSKKNKKNTNWTLQSSFVDQLSQLSISKSLFFSWLLGTQLCSYKQQLMASFTHFARSEAAERVSIRDYTGCVWWLDLQGTANILWLQVTPIEPPVVWVNTSCFVH